MFYDSTHVGVYLSFSKLPDMPFKFYFITELKLEFFSRHVSGTWFCTFWRGQRKVQEQGSLFAQFQWNNCAVQDLSRELFCSGYY